MLIALFGKSSSGKTTLARALASSLALPVRGCGDVVRDRAKLRGVVIDELSQGDHDEIDTETRQWCLTQGAKIVEGRYLDQVLSSVKVPIKLVEITASPAVRALRWADRLSHLQTVDDVAIYDAQDDAFRVRSYSDTARLDRNWAIDTSDRSENACLEELKALLSKPD